MQIGLVRVDPFKKFASVLKKRIDGCKHTMALERLARSCGMKGYRQMLEASAHRFTGSPLVQGSREELLAEWARRLNAEFSMDVSAILNPDELEEWFDRVFLPRERLVVDLDGGCETVRHVVDPRLDDANWRDSEFRQWIHRQLDRERGPRHVEFPDEGDDEAKARSNSSSPGGTRIEPLPDAVFETEGSQRFAVHGGNDE